ncbi:MAG: hypothetical protein AABZ11_00040 [Nitrospinota bacterium]
MVHVHLLQWNTPSWQELAQLAIETLKSERPDHGSGSLQSAMKRNDFPEVFEEVKNILGGPRLLQSLKSKFSPSKASDLYRFIEKWPIPVYRTNNPIQGYTNSEIL